MPFLVPVPSQKYRPVLIKLLLLKRPYWQQLDPLLLSTFLLLWFLRTSSSTDVPLLFQLIGRLVPDTNQPAKADPENLKLDLGKVDVPDFRLEISAIYLP